MSKPASKPADMYNYRAAAYLKISAKDLKISELALENLDFNVIPKSIPKQNTFLNVDTLFDIVISGSDHEYLCECKHHEMPRPLTLNSVEVKDSMLEFIAAEKYRINSIKRDGIAYLFITNCPTTKLSKELDHLKTAGDAEIIQYSDALGKRAVEKWKNFDTSIKIKVEWIRNVLIRTILVDIDEGRLSEASKAAAYEHEFRKMMDRISETNPRLVPLEYRMRNTIRFDTRDGDEDTIDVQKRGYFIEISMPIVDQLLSQKWTPNQYFARVSYHDVPFVKKCEVLHHSSVSTEKSMELVIETLNDVIKQHFEKLKYFFAINPGTYDVYCVHLEWFYRIAMSSINSKGFYDIAKIAKELPTGVSRFILANLVKESMRLRANIIVGQDLMDFLGIEDENYAYQ
jgi:hypothetical protein